MLPLRFPVAAIIATLRAERYAARRRRLCHCHYAIVLLRHSIALPDAAAITIAATPPLRQHCRIFASCHCQPTFSPISFTLMTAFDYEVAISCRRRFHDAATPPAATLPVEMRFGRHAYASRRHFSHYFADAAA